MDRHAPHINCADDSQYETIGSNTVLFHCKACGSKQLFDARYEYNAHDLWWEHKKGWFANNPEFAPTVVTIGAITFNKRIDD